MRLCDRSEDEPMLPTSLNKSNSIEIIPNDSLLDILLTACDPVKCQNAREVVQKATSTQEINNLKTFFDTSII